LAKFLGNTDFIIFVPEKTNEQPRKKNFHFCVIENTMKKIRKQKKNWVEMKKRMKDQSQQFSCSEWIRQQRSMRCLSLSSFSYSMMLPQLQFIKIQNN